MNVGYPVEMTKHPCFHAEVRGVCGRIHLPVAPRCNLRCRYCNRRYDCVNESRPGVTSMVLTPEQAAAYAEEVVGRMPWITVAGIAGPGDAFANSQETIETLRLVKKRLPHLLLCLATNGVGIAPFVDELAQIGLSHVTVTVNAVDVVVAETIYAWLREGKVVYRGREAAQRIIARQHEAVAALKARGISVKVNTIVIPGVNDHHVSDIARVMCNLGVDVMNCVPLLPSEDTPFGHLHEPSPQMMDMVRHEAARYLRQVSYCARCRADAVGIIGDDRRKECEDLLISCPSQSERPYVAVATREGMLINLHLGQAESVEIWEYIAGAVRHVETRKTPPPGGGVGRWQRLAEILRDCRAILVSDCGESPREVLEKTGIQVYVASGFIEDGVRWVWTGEGKTLLARKVKRGCTMGGCGND